MAEIMRGGGGWFRRGIYPSEPSLKKWNKILLVLNVVAVSMDPLFFYIPVIKDDEKCHVLDTKLMYTAITLRTLTDFGDIINIIVQFCNGSARTYLSLTFLRFFVVDILAILPLPQVVILIVIPRMRYSMIVDFRNVLISLVFFQYALRVLHIYPLYKKVKMTPGILTETAWARAVFNLFLFMIASHVLGASWYFLSIQRETSCWEKACRSHSGCIAGSFYCSDSLENNDYLNKFCPIKTPNASLFDFGMFLDALQSGIVESTNFPEKFFYCFLWGLRNLSSFGQNLNTSKFMWENCFAVLVTISGLVLFIGLIGNMQIYLQSNTSRLEEMRLKGQDIEQWTSFPLLSDDLQKKVKRYQQYKWRKTRGVDIENLLRDLPRDLRMNIKRELCLYLLRRVPMFEIMDEQISDAMCDRLKPVLFTEGHYIVREGYPVEEMLFFTRGKLKSVASNGGRTGFFNSECLSAGDFCGEELLTWALDPLSSSNLPTSTRYVSAIGEVEAFALTADDVKFVGSQFRRFHGKQVRHTFRFYSHQWRTWAVCYIQKAWRRHMKKKLIEVDENRLLGVVARGNECSQTLRTTVYAPRFAATALQALRRHRGSPVPIIKPTDPDFTCKE